MVKSNKIKESNSRINLRKVLYAILAIVIIILLFTLFDAFIHQLGEEYAVPDYYFTNKIIYGTIWALIFYFLFRKWATKLYIKSFVFSALISIILQARYAYEGYSWEFVIEFLFFHLLILWPVSYLVFKLFRRKINL